MDHAGLCTSVTSEELIVDTSMPAVGKLLNEQAYHSNWIMSDVLKVRLIGFADDESGIDHFLAYIGSSDHSNDIMSTVEFKTDLLEFTLDEGKFKDGNVYSLTVTVRALYQIELDRVGYRTVILLSF